MVLVCPLDPLVRFPDAYPRKVVLVFRVWAPFGIVLVSRQVGQAPLSLQPRFPWQEVGEDALVPAPKATPWRDVRIGPGALGRSRTCLCRLAVETPSLCGNCAGVSETPSPDRLNWTRHRRDGCRDPRHQSAPDGTSAKQAHCATFSRLVATAGPVNPGGYSPHSLV
jgi:hypothetical protein